MSEYATLGAGCYWCPEAVFQRVRGITGVVSGYSGGHADNPTTMQVYGGKTGHAEVVQLTYDPDIISYREILEIFFTVHDPTTLNRQGYDVGDWYRSVVFYHDDSQKAAAEDMKAHFATDLWRDTVVTQIVPYTRFWPAGTEMQNYYNNYPNQGYCIAIIDPKIQKLRQKFADKYYED